MTASSCSHANVAVLSHLISHEEALHLITRRTGVIKQAGERARDRTETLSMCRQGGALLCHTADKSCDHDLDPLNGCTAAGELMDNIGGHLNPLHLVRQLPAGMEIPGLRDRLVCTAGLKPRGSHVQTLMRGRIARALGLAAGAGRALTPHGHFLSHHDAPFANSASTCSP